MTPEYILRKSLCRPSWNKDYTEQARLSAAENIGWAPAYAEPGYTDPAKAILFGNWNYFSNDVHRLLESYGYELEWEDEWTTCSDCGKALRTSADSYGWQPSYFWVSDCEMVCIDCLDVPAYLETLEDNPRKALNDHISPADYGYQKLEGEFENGFHPGQNDNPSEIYKRLHAAGHKHLLFNIDSVGQFDVQFSIWEKVETNSAQ